MIENSGEKICGVCVHFKYESMGGWGQCIYARGSICHCSDLCTAADDAVFSTEEEKRHHMAVLRKCQRCLNKNVGTIHDLDVRSISDAIDYLVKYSKSY